MPAWPFISGVVAGEEDGSTRPACVMVLMNISMPLLDGLAATRRIKAEIPAA